MLEGLSLVHFERQAEFYYLILHSSIYSVYSVPDNVLSTF